MMRGWSVVVTMSAMLASTAPGGAQVRTVDPNDAAAMRATATTPPPPSSPAFPDEPLRDDATAPTVPVPTAGAAPVGDAAARAAHDEVTDKTYAQQDVLTAAEGVFGKGAEGLAKLVEKILKDQGEPTAYIAGREAGGAIIAGVRYGSGTLFHKVEGQRPVYWTGPSVGFDLGANGAKTFVLVYNLYDSQELFRRFPAVEGQAYFVGGFTASYLRWGKVVIIPIRLGVGWRLGANVGYMRFTEKSRWLPF